MNYILNLIVVFVCEAVQKGILRKVRKTLAQKTQNLNHYSKMICVLC